MSFLQENRRLLSAAALVAAVAVVAYLALRQRPESGGGSGNLQGVALEVGALPVT